MPFLSTFWALNWIWAVSSCDITLNIDFWKSLFIWMIFFEYLYRINCVKHNDTPKKYFFEIMWFWCFLRNLIMRMLSVKKTNQINNHERLSIKFRKIFVNFARKLRLRPDLKWWHQHKLAWQLQPVV